MEMQKGLMKLVFPIGATYITQDETNPSNILKFGTWERLKGKVCVGLDEENEEFNEIGKEGGETKHTLTSSEMPKHTHQMSRVNPNTGAGSYKVNWDNGATATPTLSACADGAQGYWASLGMNATGGNQAHNNLQPYKVVGYMWIRIA